MKIAVCIKQVPDSGSVSVDPETHTLIRNSTGVVINSPDEFPLEAALRLKEQLGGEITAITMGPPRAEEVLARAIAMGIDNGVLLTDRAFAGGDTWSTSLVLAESIRHFGPFDLVLCGKQAIDGDTAQVGPEIAAHLRWAQVAGVSDISISSQFATDRELIFKRLFENGFDVVRVQLPAVAIVLKETGEPRFGTLAGRLKYYTQGIEKVDSEQLVLSPDKIGLRGSPTRVVKTSVPQHNRQRRVFDGTPQDQAKLLASILK